MRKRSMTSYNVEPNCQVCLNQNENVYSINNVDQIIYPNSMNRDLSKMTKEQLFNMLLGQKPKTARTKVVGPVVKQTVSAKAGPVFKPKSLVQLAAEKLEHSIKRLAILPKQSDKMPTLKTLAANAMVKDKIKYFENLSDN